MIRPTRHISFALVLLLFLISSVLAAQPNDTTATRLGNYLRSLEDHGFAGVVLVAKGNEILLHEGYGMADPEAGRKMPKDAVFTVGSISKPFTAAAILKLEEAGKLLVEDPITRYFENVPDDKKGITLHHLLTHSAGLPGAIGFDFDFIGRLQPAGRKRCQSHSEAGAFIAEEDDEHYEHQALHGLQHRLIHFGCRNRCRRWRAALGAVEHRDQLAFSVCHARPNAYFRIFARLEPDQDARDLGPLVAAGIHL